MNKIPKTNSIGFYEIRMESIGGLGANLAGKMLAEAGILRQGFNGSSFSSYGSEKKGSLVKSFIRFCAPDVEVRVNSPIEEPHLLVIFHENLLLNPATTQGAGPGSIIIVNSKKSPAELREIIKLNKGTIGSIDAFGIAIQERVKLNTTMMGAVSKASGFLDFQHIKNVIEDTLGKKYASVVPSNLKAADRGFNELQLETFEENPAYPFKQFKRETPKLGYENAPIGGVILSYGNSRLKDMTTSRSGYVPILDKEKCINCGSCDMQCPDFCFEWESGSNKKGDKVQNLAGINYQYCKGCMRCVAICPTKALTSAAETEELRKKLMEVNQYVR